MEITEEIGRKTEAKKILSFMPLSKLRNGKQQRKSAKAKNKIPAEHRIRKEKPSARKERKATQTLAIVLGKLLIFLQYNAS